MSRMTWPCHIIEDRYGGAYSGGKWVAISPAVGSRLSSVENIVYGDDSTAADFQFLVAKWAEEGTHVAVGNTPDKALENLASLLTRNTGTFSTNNLVDGPCPAP